MCPRLDFFLVSKVTKGQFQATTKKRRFFFPPEGCLHNFILVVFKVNKICLLGTVPFAVTKRIEGGFSASAFAISRSPIKIHSKIFQKIENHATSHGLLDS